MDSCFAFQDVVADVLSDRVKNAIAMYKNHCPDAHALVVAGGVAANKALRGVLEKISSDAGLRFIAPPLKLCTDNAAMIAAAGYRRFQAGQHDSFAMDVRPTWPLTK